MKKYILPLLALVALASCDKEDIVVEPVNTLPDVVADANYYFKTTSENVLALRKVFNADTLCAFKSSSDFDVRAKIKDIPAEVPFELFSADGNIIGADSDFETQLTTFTVSRGISGNFKFNGVTYDYDINYPESNGPYYPFDLCGNNGAPLTTVATCNNYWKLGDNQDMGFMLRRHYYATSDLNSDGGAKSYYTRIFYGSYHYSSSNLYWWDDGMFGDEDAIPRGFYDTPITGLRLVMNPNGTKWTPEQNIIDPATGIKWYLADIYFDGDEYYTADNRRLGADLNDGAAGDFIYLYVTNDTRTGRKIALHHPLTWKYRDQMFGEQGKINQAFFGAGICSWTSHTWNVKADDFLAAVGEKVYDEWKPYYTTDKRVDFIRLYDKKMNPINPEIPANFNLNARGKDEIFVSYSFVTPEDSQWREWY